MFGGAGFSENATMAGSSEATEQETSSEGEPWGSTEPTISAQVSANAPAWTPHTDHRQQPIVDS